MNNLPPPRRWGPELGAPRPLDTPLVGRLPQNLMLECLYFSPTAGLILAWRRVNAIKLMRCFNCLILSQRLLCLSTNTYSNVLWPNIFVFLYYSITIVILPEEFAYKHMPQSHRTKQNQRLTHQKDETPFGIFSNLIFSLVFSYFQVFVFLTFLNERLEFGRGHTIKQLPRKIPDVYTPHCTSELF